MKRFLCLTFSGLIYVALLCDASHAEQPNRKPNIIFVLADDLGWSELGCYGNTFHETPHLDSLAEHGMRFTQAYASAPVCSPYRAALLTGQYPARIGITDYLRPNSANALSSAHVTLAEQLRDAGYATGMIGKWHLTGYKHHQAQYEITPNQHGFDFDIGREVKGVGNGANTWPYVFRDQSIRWIDIAENRLGEKEYLTDRLNFEAVDFIEQNKDRPFFLYLSHYAPHSILNGREDLVEKYRKKHKPGKSTRERCYLCEDKGLKGDPLNHWAGEHNPHLAAMLENIDEGVGKIRTKLKELGLLDNTILIFSSDNGGETNVTSNVPLRGGKSQLYEGGIRVPLIVSWPDVVPAKSLCNHATTNVDFYPTLLEAADVELNAVQKVDGVSILQTWKDPDAPTNREAIYWHYPLDSPHFLGGESAGAIRSGDWKLIEFFDSGKTELYSLTDDLSEQRDLSAENRDQVDRLQSMLDAWRQKVGARTPSPPLLTVSRNLTFADHFSPDQTSDRWHFTKDWSVGGGVLKRSDAGTDTTRIFLKDARFQDAIIRFDFRLGASQDIRLVTGSGGGYNAVIHVRPDHFFVQTASDQSVPYFSFRHGECAYHFDPDRWYTMTVEFTGNRLAAHLDHEHLVFATHPILDRERTYFAFQVDQFAASFDNVQIFEAAKHPTEAQNLKHIEMTSNKYPVRKTLEEEYEIQKTNAHEWLYQRDPAYRALVVHVDELDNQRTQQFPEVYQSHKMIRKRIQESRKKALNEDNVYKEILFATYRANRAIESYLISRKPEVADWPSSRREREIDRLRQEHKTDPQYLQLVEASKLAQQKLENAYPQFFISDEEINTLRKKKHAILKDDALFKEMSAKRSSAYRAQQDYLFNHDPKLAKLKQQIEQKEK